MSPDKLPAAANQNSLRVTKAFELFFKIINAHIYQEIYLNQLGG